MLNLTLHGLNFTSNKIIEVKLKAESLTEENDLSKNQGSNFFLENWTK